MFTTFLKESENEDDAIKARALNNRGHTKYMQVEFEAALEDYNKALDLLPDFAVARYNRGTIFYRMSKFDKAKEDLQMAVDAEASNKEYLEALEKCEAELKKWEKNPGVAFQNIEEVVAKDVQTALVIWTKYNNAKSLGKEWMKLYPFWIF